MNQDQGATSYWVPSVDPPDCQGWGGSPISSSPIPLDFFEVSAASVVAQCLRAGADPSARTRWGSTPLMRAARRSKDVETLAILLEAGADPNASADDGSTALLTAAFWRTDGAALVILLDGGADPNLAYRADDDRSYPMDGETALHRAARNGNVEGVSALLEHGADATALDSQGRTPFDRAAATLGGRWGRLGYHANAIIVIRELLREGAEARTLADHGWGELHSATLIGSDYRAIADLVEQGHDPNGQTSSGWTALHVAALVNESPRAIAALLDGGADPDARFGNGRTPLHCAAFANRNPEVVEALVAGGADPSARTTIGWTPLHAAAYGNPNPEIVEALLDAGANPDSTLADSWDGKIHFPNEESLMDAPYLLTLDGALEMINGRSTTLHVAAGHARDLSVVGALLDGGADRNSRDVEGETPLFKAMAGLLGDDIDLGVVGQLLEAGADPNARSEIDQTPLHAAANFGLVEAATVLLDGGADPNAGGRSPLHNAATRPSVELTNLLLARGADPNARNTKFLLFHIAGDTPLHSVADSNSDWGVVDALLRGGADPNARNSEGRTALFIAAAPSLGDSDDAVVRRMIDAGADPNARDMAGRTPLIAALIQDVVNPAVVGALLDGGADASLTDKKGLTPWDLAQKHAALRETELYWRLNNARFD
ncbi:MAG: ankyrin repeat domain-containing protein [Gammaproteobacteria bacterium]|nr:ankyrin repeat domain-containing protein [Gammaproteobacteria bacterium]